ncbi:uncharacterized membrane protein At1g16860-like [Amaranthus tricolor]|uniref:uncharacterized membrane protein At1g16860-like n=1 Tax=Amaranthus tricolor TaxID=29722 RepID=UPI00258BBA26|nr:uncharacterized membrane protein At1g16860-like [Amaranthus tricolor]
MNPSSSSSDSITNCYISIPKAATLILIFLFVIGFAVSLFIFIEVHNAIFFISSILLSAIVASFLLWNVLCFHRNTSLLLFLRSFPVTDLRIARPGQLVKITGPVSCGDVSLESSYEKVPSCVYTSTLLYEYEGFGLKAFNVQKPCLFWRLAYTERFSTDFYISDKHSGIRTLVKAGCGRRLIPLIVESSLVYTKSNRILSPNLTNWLADRNLPTNSRVIRLEEGYIKEGDSATVIGMLQKGGDDIVMVVQPPELISTGCLWQRLLLPVDFDGLLLALGLS